MTRIVLIVMMLSATVSHGQVARVPDVAKEAFEKQYPDADSIRYHDNILSVRVSFQIKGEQMTATYTNKGQWKQTEKKSDYDLLDPEIQQGYSKSKYSADWTVKETSFIYLPDGSENIRLKIEKNDLQKKHLYFDKSGRLIRESIAF